MISLVIPSSWREERLSGLLGNLTAQGIPGLDALVVFDYGRAVDDSLSVVNLMMRYPWAHFLFSRQPGCWAATNWGLAFARFDLIGWTADDAWPADGALFAGIERFAQVFPDGRGLLVFNDLQHEGRVAGHAITTRRFLSVLFGKPAFPDFNHWYCDTITADRARSLDRFHYAADIIWEHRHWTVGKAERDRLNDANETGEKKLADKALKDCLDREWLNGGRQLALEALR